MSEQSNTTLAEGNLAVQCLLNFFSVYSMYNQKYLAVGFDLHLVLLVEVSLPDNNSSPVVSGCLTCKTVSHVTYIVLMET